MWLLDYIKNELEETIAKIDSKAIKDAKLLANYPQLNIALQILGIIMDDVRNLDENKKRME